MADEQSWLLEMYDSLAFVNETINRLGLVPESFQKI
jgi:hypothetical protein